MVTQSVHFGHGSNSKSDIVSDSGEHELREEEEPTNYIFSVPDSVLQFEAWAAEYSNAPKTIACDGRHGRLQPEL